MSQKKYRIKRQIAKALAAGAFAAVCQPVFASGFQVLEQNVTNLGTAYAGTAALAADASTGYFNPAGLTRISNEQVAGSLIWIHGHPKLRVDSARTTNGPVGANTTVGPATTRASGYALIPTLHYSSPLAECWTFGFNVTSPFGLRNNYKTESPARYMATRSELKTVDLSPSLAYKFSDCFSIGAGVDALYTFAKLEQRVGGIANPVTDGSLENSADGWGWGYHAGLMWEVSDYSRLGVNYRSRVKSHVKGESLLGAFTLPTGSVGPALTRSKVTSSVDYPESVTLSGFHSFNECWDVLADVQWTHWKRFSALVLRFEEGPNSSTQSIPENFKDSYRVALGTAYHTTESFTYRLGVAYDRTPVRDQYRTVRIPDSDRLWVALGSQYRINECMAVEFGYAHLFFKRAAINEVAPIASNPAAQGLQNLKGKNSMAADIVGIQFTWTLG